MRIGVLGCGQWGRNHARTLARLGHLGGVADLDADRASAVAAECGSVAMSPDGLLRDPGLDGLVIALPPVFHADHALEAIARGKHVLVEKPMALDLGDAARIADAARRRGLVAMTGHVLRFHPAFEALEDLLRGGTLGRPLRMETVRTGMGRSHAGSDAVMDLMPHDLAMILAVADLRPETAASPRAELLSAPGADLAELRLSFPGLSALCRASNASPHRERRLALRCEGGLLTFDDAEPWARKLALLEPGAEAPRHLPVAEREPLMEELRHFAEGIGGAPVTRSTAAEGLRVLTILARATGRAGLRPATAAPEHMAERMAEPRVA